MAYTTIDDPSEYFTTVLSTSTGSALTINTGFKPDWLWTKARNFARSHELHDTTRGDNKRLKSDATTAEESYSNYLAFTSTGATFGTNHNLGYHTEGATTGVSWAWKANGGTTTTNDASSTGVGDQDSVYQANTTAGFSIVTYTGTGSDNEDYAHGLGASPELMIIKARSASTGWSLNHISKGMTSGYIQLNADGAFTSASNNIKAVSSTTFRTGVDSWVNGSGVNFVGYFFKSIQGYSKFGSYTGNGNADGPFVYTGFKPAWIMLKRTDSANNWHINDSVRDIDNPVIEYLYADTTAGDDNLSGGGGLDFLSNGFKIRSTTAAVVNADGGTYIYIAFAKHPFVSSEGVPVTAR